MLSWSLHSRLNGRHAIQIVHFETHKIFMLKCFYRSTWSKWILLRVGRLFTFLSRGRYDCWVFTQWKHGFRDAWPTFFAVAVVEKNLLGRHLSANNLPGHSLVGGWIKRPLWDPTPPGRLSPAAESCRYNCAQPFFFSPAQSLRYPWQQANAAPALPLGPKLGQPLEGCIGCCSRRPPAANGGPGCRLQQPSNRFCLLSVSRFLVCFVRSVVHYPKTCLCHPTFDRYLCGMYDTLRSPTDEVSQRKLRS